MSDVKLVPVEPTRLMLADGRLEGISDANLRAAYRFMLAAAPSPWQPIETAPKDGTPFLGYNATRKAFRLIESVHVEYATETTWCDASGFYEIRLTHWMPLPEPPKAGTTV